MSDGGAGAQLDALGALLDKVAKKQKVDTVPRQLDQMLEILDGWEVRRQQAQWHIARHLAAHASPVQPSRCAVRCAAHVSQDTSEDDFSRAKALTALESRLKAVGVEQSEQASSREMQSAIQKVRGPSS
jgi:hypothetical protein